MSCEEVKRGVEVTKVTITDLNMDWPDDTILEGDPDVFIRILIDGSAIGETDYQVGETAPVEFDTQIVLSPDQASRTIVFEIYDHDNSGDNDYMGSVEWDPDYNGNDEILTVVGETNTLELEFYWFEE